MIRYFCPKCKREFTRSRIYRNGARSTCTFPSRIDSSFPDRASVAQVVPTGSDTSAEGKLDKIREETEELIGTDADHRQEELGDLLFAVVNAARFYKVDSEQALQAATDKFIARFAQVEELARERGIEMKTASLETLDALWDEVKRRNSRF